MALIYSFCPFYPLIDNAADMWITAAAAGTIAASLKNILAIPKLSPKGARQLSTDLG